MAETRLFHRRAELSLPLLPRTGGVCSTARPSVTFAPMARKKKQTPAESNSSRSWIWKAAILVLLVGYALYHGVMAQQEAPRKTSPDTSGTRLGPVPEATAEVPDPVAPVTPKVVPPLRTPDGAQLVATYYKNGQLKMRSHVLRSKTGRTSKHGPWTLFGQDGVLQAEGDFRHGKEHGRWRWWHPSMVVREVRHFQDGVLEGEFRLFSEGGEPLTSGAYSGGKRHGRWRTWFPNGEPASDEQYEDGKLHGSSRRYHESGELSEEGRYERGEPVGTHSYFHENGELAERGNFVEGKEEGVWTVWDESGNKTAEKSYQKGEVSAQAGDGSEK